MKAKHSFEEIIKAVHEVHTAGGTNADLRKKLGVAEDEGSIAVFSQTMNKTRKYIAEKFGKELPKLARSNSGRSPADIEAQRKLVEELFGEKIPEKKEEGIDTKQLSKIVHDESQKAVREVFEEEKVKALEAAPTKKRKVVSVKS
jgi:hypothetical protein